MGCELRKTKVLIQDPDGEPTHWDGSQERSAQAQTYESPYYTFQDLAYAVCLHQ